MTLWKRFLTNRGALLGLAILIAVIAVALLAPVLYPRGPWAMVQRPFLVPFSTDGLPLGTDTLGRDVLAGLVYGARVSLLVGLVSTLMALLIGVPLGALAGFYGKWVDEGAMRFTEFFQTIPNFALAIVLVAILEPTLTSITIAIAIVSWPPVARLVRAEVMSVTKREYVDAARLAGLSNLSILVRQVLPNTVSPIIVMASLMVATAILLESSLSFLGLGDPNIMSWGFQIGAARTVIRSAWWLSFFPGVAIVLTVLALNLIGEGLNDALNPHLSRKGRS
ncbi:Dipeptide transport system permease protein DppC [Pseudooceanicola marinus]|uniref:Dipeptide transport system permease protein DppC n=1 Tax=Pseudooceanicola marinus TaxID=396013 RepID=A0A1X6YUM8_9RHOB|nr:ABC transporter permease [Pseudooceanicola marinus]MBY5973143.1 ABC transporter permease [Ferrimonas balearica]MCA1337080.1 ABC transporter permease [Pseudooceanicola marinus]PJE26229.1 ABC transporter permease [Pseudooceanicola marinus]SLN31678.1 Dipeptide transport system permease protein DppC [Pseudooceanicola marinus]